jgi:NAD(P)-dependent dehydrogenase (short-subunit alcohol dehydrogenase family)
MSEPQFDSLRGRVCVVTGAGRGFGRLMALALVRQGAKVLGSAARKRAELEETAQLARAVEGAGQFVPRLADVSKPRDCDDLVAATVAQFGRIDVLINNAARGPREANEDFYNAKPRFWETPVDAFARMVDTNLTGQFCMARAAMPHMLQQRFGRIVNISTSLPTMVMQGLAVYGACKAALEVLSVVWARDLANTGITCNVLLPGGPADTALIPGGEIGTRAKQDFRAGKGPRGDEGRVGGILPAEIMVTPTLWLAADDSAAYTGRRFVAKDWDPDLTPEAAAQGAMQAQFDAPRIM